LDEADKLRQLNKQLIQKYEALTQSLFLDMFGDPGNTSRRFELTTIGDACYFIKDGPHVSPNYVSKGIPFISVNNIIKGNWDFSNVKYISQNDHDIFKKRCNPQKGDVLYTKGGTTGFAKYIDIDLEFSNWVHLAVLKFDKNILNGKFLEQMLNSNYCYTQSQLYTRGIANRDLVLGQMKRIKLLLPPITLQNKFAEHVQAVEAQKAQAQAALQKSEELFNSLLQRAFSDEGLIMEELV
jgi:type I restriction enzyme S subunit